MRHRKHRHNTFIFPIIVLFLAIAAIIYFLFVRPVSISCGLVVNKDHTSRGTVLKLVQGNKTHTVKIGKNIYVPDADAYDVVKRGLITVSVSPCKSYEEKVLSKKDDEVELESVTIPLRKNALYYNKNFKPSKVNVILPGYSIYKFIVGGDGKIGAVITDIPDVETVMVGISNSDFSSLNHSVLELTSKKDMEISTKSEVLKVPKNRKLKVIYKNNNIELYIIKKYEKDNFPDTLIGKTSDRISIKPKQDIPILVPSLIRKNGYIPSYYGILEVSIKDNSLRVINDVDMENYLKFVVPSEIPSSGGIEAYKVQAVAARTYLLSDMLSGRFAGKGFHVDDTTLSQVYNSQPTNSLCEKAVDETKGLIMTYKNKIIDAKYYSTSCGLGAPFNEIYYSENGFLKDNPEPYLQYNDFTESNIKDLTNEEKATEFFKDWTIHSYDSFSQYFRWKYTIDSKLLETTINSNIYNLYCKNKESFKTKAFLKFYKQAQIPKDGIGKIEDIQIVKRGTAGNVMEIEITAAGKEYKIHGERIIRNLLISKGKEIELIPLYGGKLKTTEGLPSGFFAIEKNISGKKLKDITIYGGGYGHGVGMSQYGAIGLARQGKRYDEILNAFYKDIEISDYRDKVPFSFQ